MDEQNQQPNPQGQSGQPAQPPESQQPVPPTQNPPASGRGYGKRPLWQWVLIYIVVGGLLYLIIYLLFFRGSGSVY